MTQENNNDCCNIMYRIRDSINDGDTRAAMVLAGELHRKLLLIASNEEVVNCILDCETGIKEK